MRPSLVNASTGETERVHLEPGDSAPKGMRLVLNPRVACKGELDMHNEYKHLGLSTS